MLLHGGIRLNGIWRFFVFFFLEGVRPRTTQTTQQKLGVMGINAAILWQQMEVCHFTAVISRFVPFLYTLPLQALLESKYAEEE